MIKKEKKRYYQHARLVARFRNRISEAIEVLQHSFIKKPQIDSIVMDWSAQSMARRGIELRL